MKKLKTRILSVITAISAAVCSMVACGTAQASAASEPRIIISLGDSYSAGEGIEPFYGQDAKTSAKLKDQDWLAHRSENAWGGMLTLPGVSGTMAQNKGTNWFFAAASGAETKHLHEGQTVSYSYGGKSGKVTLDPQDKLLKEYSGKIDYVTFSIGGNDIGFVEIMTKAISSDADKLKEYLDKKMSGKEFEQTKADIKQFYKDVAELAGSQASLIVAGYPTLFNSEGFKVKGVPLKGTVKVSAESAAIINAGVETLNGVLSSLVDECRAEGINIYFAPVDFTGHEAYTADPYINDVMFKAQAQDLNSKGLISAYSMHPNKKGAEVYAAAVQKVINNIESGASKTNSSTGVTGVKADIDGSTIKLSWNAVSGATGYTVYQYQSSAWKKLKTVTKTTLKLSKLTNNKTYRFMVRATVGGKLTAKTEDAQIKVKLCYMPVVTATQKDSKLTLKWTEVNNATKYGIYQYSGGQWKQITTTKKLTCGMTVKSGKTYKLAVRAYVNGKWTEIGETSTVSVKAS